MEIIMVDTSAIYALLDQSDNNHSVGKKILTKLSKSNIKIILTNFLVAECHALISSKLGHELARQWITNICWEIERVSEADEERAKEIIIAHADKTYSYTDATTFAVMERLGVKKCFSFDKHFTQFGFVNY